MQSLTSGLYTEDFFYGYPYDQVIPPLPAQFDYEGAALTNAGLLTCPPATFTLEYSRNATLNADAALPYGGSPDSNSYYLRFPALSWSGTAGLFLHVSTTAVATLTFDRSWSGYIGDTFSVVVNGIEAMSISGSAGHPWVRSSVTLPPGDSDIAFVLNCAPFSTGTVRQGQAQASSVVDLFRLLRLTNLSITNVAAMPQADDQKLAMVGQASWTQNTPLLKVTSGALRLSADTGLIWPAKLSGPMFLQGVATLTTGAGSFVGKYGQMSAMAESVLAAVSAVENDVLPERSGFGLNSSAQLAVESTLVPDVASYARPLLFSQLTMSSPVFVNGRPVSPLAVSETEIEYGVEATVLDKINPTSPNNQLPLAPTLRWLSLGAHFDPSSGELQTWYDTTGSGATWTPGARGVYAPSVSNYAIRNRVSGVTTVNYPAVHFDATHGDHLLATLPAPTDGFTFVFVGSFTRYRGALDDSCPLIDYAGGPISYAAQRSIQRGILPWADVDTAASVFLGLVPSNKQEPTVSKIAWHGTGGDRSSDAIVISDGTPMVVVYSVSGPDTFVMAAPLMTGQNHAAGRMTAVLPTPVPDATASFTLGKARRKPPMNGLFATGSMSLLELSYYTSAVDQYTASELVYFLTGLYSPVDIDAGPTVTGFGAGNVDTEQLMIYANAPELPVALISGGKTTVTDWYLSDATGMAYAQNLAQAGVPLVLVTNRDYTSIVDAGASA